MSLYNMLMGYNPACIFLLPLLGRRTEEYPRFRDCFLSEDQNIAVYTRVGGGNRNEGFGEEMLYEDPNFVRTYDDDFDSTYATYEFKCPEKWTEDFEKIVEGDFGNTSEDYQNMLREWYPKLGDVFDQVFAKVEKEEAEVQI